MNDDFNSSKEPIVTENKGNLSASFKRMYVKRTMPPAAELRDSVALQHMDDVSTSKNKQDVAESKLDRALISEDFHGVWASVSASLLPQLCSDHSPLIVIRTKSWHEPFRF
ncbi:hypothetical protein C2S51_027719 [Perilla frutescens var. frutescens]|nr:hypothetical protein C2S51_027719 [Perilla frutescens var. frutescens]